MLPPARRVRTSAQFADVFRRGARAARPLLDVAVTTDPPSSASPRAGGVPQLAAAGLVVGKSVGGSVVRHRTARRLRHLLRDRLDALPPGTLVVVRAQAGAGVAHSAALGADLDAALALALTRGRADASRRGPSRSAVGGR